MDREKASRPFPLARYKFYDLNFYYAYGNTPAEDFLRSCAGVQKPSVLSLGCGDIRSCFYTLWKHFDSNASQQFDGADFLLNDWSSAVLARNILFVLLCVQLPENTEERKKWLSAMWAVWYCHELYPQHQKILNDGLTLLLKYSESFDVWACANNPLHSLVRFTSPVVLEEMSQIWKLWLEMQVSVDQMHSSRSRFEKPLIKKLYGTLEKCASTHVSNIMLMREDSTESGAKKVSKRIPEVVSHLTSGNSYAESVFNTDTVTTPRTANLTLYEREDCEYNLFYSSVPFLSYFHTVDFSPEVMREIGVKESVYDSMLVQSEGFKVHPLLANSVQQFSMWIQSSSAVLNGGKDGGKGTVTFTFNNEDALAFCQHTRQKGNQFDVVFSSNLLDHLGLPNLVLSAVPLLTLEGILFTGTMLYKHTSFSCLEDFLLMCFGFDCKLLPVILGVRCINHEGKGFASPVWIEPPPADKQIQRSLVWQGVHGQPMAISKLPPLEPGSVTEGLVNSFVASTLPLMSTNSVTNEDEIHISRTNCIETAMVVLQTFMSSVNASNDYHFCDTLTSGVMQQLKSFLSGLQTQALLHNLHMHFTVDEISCPMCIQRPIEECIGLFCAKVSLPLPFRMIQPNFMALIHPYSSLKVQPGQNLGLYEKDIHVIDCFDGTVQGNQLLLKFFAPKSFAERDLNVSTAMVLGTKEPGGETKTSLEILSTNNIRGMQVDFVQYIYSRGAAVPRDSLHGSFGDLISNVYTADCVVSDVALSDSLLDSLTLSNFNTNKVSSSELQLTCGALELNLKFLYPVNYNRINIKLSRARRNVRILCPRQIHHFDEERPFFRTHPDHLLSLPPRDLVTDKKIFSNMLNTQLQIHSFTSKD